MVDSRRKKKKFYRMEKLSGDYFERRRLLFGRISVIDRNFKVGGRRVEEIKVKMGDFIVRTINILVTLEIFLGKIRGKRVEIHRRKGWGEILRIY